MDKKQVSMDTVLTQNKDLVASSIDGEVVLMSIENGKYYGINPIGSRIWEILAYPTTYIDLIDTLLTEFDIDRITCEKKVTTFLKEIAAENIIEIKNQ